MSPAQKLCTSCRTEPALKRFSPVRRRWVYRICNECARKQVAASRARKREQDEAWVRFLDAWKVGA